MKNYAMNMIDAADDAVRTGSTLADIWGRKDYEVVENYATPFPQANDFSKVLDLVRKVDLGLGHNSTEKLMSHFKFDRRQADYYANAAIFLGALEKYSAGRYRTTALGHQIAIAKSERASIALAAKQVLSSSIFNHAITDYLTSGELPDNDFIQFLIETDKSQSNGRVGAKTIERRASTIRNWIEYIDHSL